MKCPMCWNAIGCPIHSVVSDSSDNEDAKYETKLGSMLSSENNGTDVEMEIVKEKPKPARKKR